MSDMDLPLAVRMMQDGYLMEIDQLQAENEELRKELAVTNPLFETLNATNDGLLAENAKLRELCTALYRCRDKVAECATCEEVKCPFAGRCMMHARMRELGVEV